MLSKKFKLPIQEFLHKKPVFIRHAYFFTIKKFHSELLYPRFGLIIGGGIIKKATQRNKIKRIVFDYLRSQKNKLPIFDYLFILKQSVQNTNIQGILKDVNHSLGQK